MRWMAMCRDNLQGNMGQHQRQLSEKLLIKHNAARQSEADMTVIDDFNRWGSILWDTKTHQAM